MLYPEQTSLHSLAEDPEYCRITRSLRSSARAASCRERGFLDGGEGQLMEMEMLDMRGPVPETLDEDGV